MNPQTASVQGLRNNVILQFDHRFKDAEKVDTYACATLLDPRFKIMYLEPLAHAGVVKNLSDQIIAHGQENPTVSQAYVPPAESADGLWDMHDEMVTNIVQIIVKFI